MLSTPKKKGYISCQMHIIRGKETLKENQESARSQKYYNRNEQCL